MRGLITWQKKFVKFNRVAVMQVSEMYNECVRALKNFADSARFKGAVIGLSGGIDSSVVA